MFTNVFSKHPLEEAVQAAAQFGYKAVELLVGWGANHLEHDMPQRRVAEIRRMVRDRGLAVAGVHTSLGARAPLGAEDKGNRTDIERLRLFCEKCVTLGCDLIKVSCGRLAAKDGDGEDDRRAAEWLREASDLAAEYHVRLVGEIHFGQRPETAEQAAQLVELVGRANFGIIFDAGNMFIAGTDSGDRAVESLGNRIFHVHIKDVKRCSQEAGLFHYGGQHFCGAFLGEGDVDHGPLFRRLRAMAYASYLSCECMKKDDPWETARREADALARMLAAVRSYSQ